MSMMRHWVCTVCGGHGTGFNGKLPSGWGRLGSSAACSKCVDRGMRAVRAAGAESQEPEPVAGSGGAHLDEGKLRMDLIPPEADEAMAGILGYGLVKYSARNWEKGIDWMRVYASIRRHMLSWEKGEDLDPESGLPHLDHALTDIAFLVTYARRSMDGDDRPAAVGRSQGGEGPCRSK